ncbi:hypothetical protein SISNIDRAFT_489186 [Sistotremastrum niveocremeum HHB9708]|uniref:Arrestin-like N-terminal domain-containing protein n=1 Tax=Sistotremastrum niveocremeum HHB9708 TaxID=1314777 RepID=A0A164QB85_9AGAM|nr:hypothetical protein SISNIDRAFT_489186 [Sistotremastrum niveocremeum HHB9708]
MAPLPNPVQHYATREVQAGSIVLSVASYSSSSSGLPIFVQGQDIVGNVSLPYVEGVRKVSITFRGFLQSKQSPSTVAAIYETAPIIEVESVLYSWIRSSECPTQMSFVIKVPTTTADSKALPSSFRGSKFSITYELHLKIKRSGFKSKIEITRPCGLLRCPIPTSPTQNMLNSYMHRLPLPTSISPETGWYECSIAETYGTCRSGSGKISSKLYLPEPLVYSRIGHIPLRLSVTSNNAEIIQLLSSPGLPRLCLVQEEQCSDDRSASQAEVISTQGNKYCPRRVACSASTWLSSQSDISTKIVTFAGEIALDRSLAPSLSFDQYCMKYYVVLFPWKCAGLELARSEDIALIQQEVTIIATHLLPNIPSFAPEGAKSHRVVLQNQSLLDALDSSIPP